MLWNPVDTNDSDDVDLVLSVNQARLFAPKLGVYKLNLRVALHRGAGNVIVQLISSDVEVCESDSVVREVHTQSDHGVTLAHLTLEHTVIFSTDTDSFYVRCVTADQGTSLNFTKCLLGLTTVDTVGLQQAATTGAAAGAASVWLETQGWLPKDLTHLVYQCILYI